jgi:serine/threonine-protein kinase RsbW
MSTRQIIGRVSAEEFVGRGAELQQIVSHALTVSQQDRADQGLLILMAPVAGVSELLRQTFDQLFNARANVAPIYFTLPQSETTPVSAAIEFLNTFLLQYIAFRRGEPSLTQSSLTLNELSELAPAPDLDWIQELLDGYDKHRFDNDDYQLVRFCLTAPRRVPAKNPKPFVMVEAVNQTVYVGASVPFSAEVLKALTRSNVPFALAALRRDMLRTAEAADLNTSSLKTIHLERLSDDDARKLVDSAARRRAVTINEETRDLIVQQLECSPFYMTSLLRAARDKQLDLNSYLACERLYVDEILGGNLYRYFTTQLERVAPLAETRKILVRLLCEAVPSGGRTSSFAAWEKRLQMDSPEVEEILRALNTQEFINWDGETVDTEAGPLAWRDFVRSRFRLDSLREPRALVVADMMAAALKRAPQTIAHHYRRAAGLRVRELIEKFNAQRVPKSFFDEQRFSELYKGATPEEVSAGIEAETELIRLPQIFHAAAASSFGPELSTFGEESSVVAHGFEAGSYTDANEVVWLVGKIDSKLEAGEAQTVDWLDRLSTLGRRCGFMRTQMWLIANAGFTADANQRLRTLGAYGSSEQQFEMLAARLVEIGGGVSQPNTQDEVVMILPMGSDYEVLAANAVEQVARKLNFRNEAINQIKTAIVEACINASEHSLSPDRKIYQRFRVESDKLVVTIASRGIVPADINGNTEVSDRRETGKVIDQRRGWGIKLIKTLMDEVEFERVDEGTSLRMTKYLRPA